MKPSPTAAALPSEDKRWKIVDAKMRRFAHQPHALIEILCSVQEAFGFLGEDALRFVAKSLRVPLGKVYGVATFYNFFRLKPKGEHTCVFCMGTACYVKGAAKIVDAVEKRTGIKVGETTADQRLSLLSARCIGACSLAPAVIYDGQVASRQTPESAVERIDQLAPPAASASLEEDSTRSRDCGSAQRSKSDGEVASTITSAG
jgi:bidirectional [NiFe] hydrogenase diaphorase subunit